MTVHYSITVLSAISTIYQINKKKWKKGVTNSHNAQEDRNGRDLLE